MSLGILDNNGGKSQKEKGKEAAAAKEERKADNKAHNAVNVKRSS